jgi:hypothetical protein
MANSMKRILPVLLLALSTLSHSQIDTSKSAYQWPYNMPLLGKKAVERGYKIQLPYGLNFNFVYNRMDLEITQFGMSIGNDPNSPLNQLIEEYVTLETLNFKNTIARANGMNLRADVWILPFWNVYGLYSNNNGSTEVSLQPEWYDEEGNLLLSLPVITSEVNFSANTYGIGSTFVGKIYKDYFFSVDGNMSWSHSEILNDPAVLSVISARVGRRISLKNDMKLALYVGAMYRGFVDNEGNFGAVAIDEALPNIGNNVFSAIEQQISLNNEKIAALDPNNPLDQIQIEILEKGNERLYEIESAFEGLISSDVNYGIKKDLVNHWSVQFGFNFEINDNLTFRGEFGKGTGNDFVMTGIQYRFGLKRN